MRQLLISLFLLAAFAGKAQQPIGDVIEYSLERARQQSMFMASKLEHEDGKLPKTFEKGKLVTSNYQWWCSGFYPGVLWMLYADHPSDQLKHYAQLFTARVEQAKKKTDTHDLGFMLYCSFGQGYAITHDSHYLDVIIEASDNLSGRFNATVGAIKSWDWARQWQFPVIIDNMMNLEMLCFATKATGNARYARIAESHADTTMKNHFRNDYSSFHVIGYDPITGKADAWQTFQGYADNSAWARGQAWALYGYTMMYRELRKPEYLEQARNIASFIINHPNMPVDGVPYWDFNAPDIPYALRDASAAAVMASAFVELSQLDTTEDSTLWYAMAEKQIRTLSTPEYLSAIGENGGFILNHSVGSIPGGTEIDVPLTYADYYFVEALLRMKNLTPDPSPEERGE